MKFQIILAFYFATVKASFFSEYILGEGERVLFAKTSRETVINPPEVMVSFPLPQDPKKLSQVAIDNGASRHIKRKFHTIRLNPNGVWTRFNFWEAGSAANELFQFKINVPHLLDVTDFMCAGDSFTIAKADSLRGTEEIASTFGKGAFDNCLTFAASPQQAWNSENFSHVRHLLEPDTYQLQIFANKSPAGAGQGALRLEAVRVSKKTRRNFRLIESKLPFRFAALVCDMYGMELAQIENENEAIEAFKFVYDTLGPKETAFIGGFAPSTATKHDLDESSEKDGNEGGELLTPFYIYTGKRREDGQILTSSTQYPPSSVICRVVERA